MDKTFRLKETGTITKNVSTKLEVERKKQHCQNRRKGRQCKYKTNTEVRSRNHCYHGKTRSITYSKCMSVALVIQQENRMRRIILSSVACPAL
jgi:hypothetical protein